MLKQKISFEIVPRFFTIESNLAEHFNSARSFVSARKIGLSGSTQKFMCKNLSRGIIFILMKFVIKEKESSKRIKAFSNYS